MGHGLRCSKTCGFFLDQGSNSYLLHWKSDPLPLSHQGSPIKDIFRHEWQAKCEVTEQVNLTLRGLGKLTVLEKENPSEGSQAATRQKTRAWEAHLGTPEQQPSISAF